VYFPIPTADKHSSAGSLLDEDIGHKDEYRPVDPSGVSGTLLPCPFDSSDVPTKGEIQLRYPAR